jgi:acyl carrier protein
MNSMQQRIRQVFREVFDDDEMDIWDEMAAKDVPDWDSLAHVKLIIGLEEEFGIKFATSDIVQMSCINDLKKALVVKGVTE